MSAPLVVWVWGVETHPKLHIARATGAGTFYVAPALCSAELSDKEPLVKSTVDLGHVTNPQLCPLCQVEFVMLVSVRVS